MTDRTAELEAENSKLKTEVERLKKFKDHCFVAVKDCHDDNCDYHGLPSVMPYVQCLNAITAYKDTLRKFAVATRKIRYHWCDSGEWEELCELLAQPLVKDLTNE